MLKNITKFSLPEIEEKVLEFWRSGRIFEKSLAKNSKRKKFIFFEGPPTANGRPGIHHILARAFKDIIPRYKTMRGFFVPRRGGWDTHGLPVEIEVEKQLGFSSKKDIEKFGIAEFNAKCRESVWTYKDEWEKLTRRMGFWLNLQDPYVTYKNSYMETLWWILKRAWDKKLLYKGHKVVPWCPRCGTALSSHELALGYKETEDRAVYIKFRVNSDSSDWKDTSILSWTTTPWTLPGNVALAVGDNIDYVGVQIDGAKEFLILSKNAVRSVLAGHSVDVVHKYKGRDLVGLKYEPLFDIPFFKESKTAYGVYPADFVATEDGAGVVHTAVMYGEDDYNLGMKVGLPAVHTVDEQGKFVSGVRDFSGMKAKDQKTEALIIDALKNSGNLFSENKYKHEYPFCWRCGSALLYYARNSWFVEMSSLRSRLMSENQKINWVPEHLKSGRFGEWLREVKDWAISRERFWGTPLPIWECGQCKNTKVIGGVVEFERALGKSSNKYVFMRHGEAENITRHLINCHPEPEKLPLTLRGRVQVEKSVKAMKREKIDVIFASDIMRTKQTAEIVAEKLGVKETHFDPRIREFDFGDFNGKKYEDYAKYYGSRAEKFAKRTPNGENHTDLRKRAYEFLRDIELKYKNKTILVITHDGVVYMLHSIAKGWSDDAQLSEKEKRGVDYVRPAGFEKEEIKNVPRDPTGAFDMHRPYIDKIKFKCDSCGGEMKRVEEVADVWFDSGAMPFAQARYPFSKKSTLQYPADYISEGIDQTRGWFYTLLAVSSILGMKAPYKNVISLGLLLDKNGQKMSKSKGNTINPWDMISKYGIDAVRWYFFTLNQPGESKRFDEEELAKVSRRMFSLLYNSFAFFNLYADKEQHADNISPQKLSTLDFWILARLSEVVLRATKALDSYDVVNSARAIEELVDDVSRWYIRRSRRRLQHPENKEDYRTVSVVLRSVLSEIARLIAPFSPFFADALYLSLPHKKESVHLESWPTPNKFYLSRIGNTYLSKMREARDIASMALAKRAETGMKIRQPLKSATVKKDASIKLSPSDNEFIEILKEEINVKEIIFDSAAEETVQLDTKITNELREEGIVRELIRTIQGLRQDAGFRMGDEVVLYLYIDDGLKLIINRNIDKLKTDVSARTINFARTEKFDIELETKLDEYKVWIGIKRER